MSLAKDYLPTTRAKELFAQHRSRIHRDTDRLFAALMIGQWLAAILIAIVYSPYAWEGKVRSVHFHVYVAVFLGGIISSFPVGLALLHPGAVVSRQVIGVSQMLWSALFIHLTGGRIETHFHVFGSLAFLAFYRDWTVLGPASAVVAIDHVARQFLWPESVYGVPNPEWWRFLEHAFWVAFEDVFLIIACLRGTKELRDICARRAELEVLSAKEQEKSRQLDLALQQAIEARAIAEHATQAKSQFLANMSHELRTPLNGVLGMAELISRTPVSEKQRHYIGTIRRSGDALLTLINDILDISKIEAGKLALEEIELDPIKGLHAVADLLAVEAHAKGIELACAIAADVPAELVGDPVRLQQVLTNLVGNAVKFTERGEVVVRLTKVEDSADQAVLRFEVTDTGIGIGQQDCERLFQAFSQVDNSSSRKYGGTGLGLAISRQLVTMMGGTIGVTSAPGKGSTFWFLARFAKRKNSPAQASQAVPPEVQSARVLVVDDNDTNRQILKEHLERWVSHVECFPSGATALGGLVTARASGLPFGVVVSDYQMPQMTGLELARQIRQLPDGDQVKIIILSSVDNQNSAERGAGLVDAWRLKPTPSERLLSCLISVLGGESAAASPSSASTGIARLRSRSGRKGLRLLMAEDNPVNQQVALEMLSTLGYEVDLAQNGREALEAAAEKSYDAILMDCQMPEVSGYEAAQRIRRREGEGEHIPIIAITAHALEGDREKVLAAGMDDYIAKPLSIERLAEMVARWTPQPEGAQSTEVEPVKAAEPEVSLLSGVRRSRRVLELFLAQLPQAEEQIKQAIASGEPQRLAEDAHRFKGSCVAIGASRMAAICVAIEKEKDLAQASLHIAALEAETRVLRNLIEGELAAATRPQGVTS